MTDLLFNNFKKHSADTIEWLKGELMSIQTGHATPAVLDSVKIDVYGTQSTVDQVASVSVEDPKTLLITPWDTSIVKDIEKSLRDADLGLGISASEKGVRISFPELTTESRERYAKMVKQKHEDARVSLRQERDDLWQEIQKKEKDGEITEDEKFKLKENMEDQVKKAQDELDQIAENKTKEVSGE